MFQTTLNNLFISYIWLADTVRIAIFSECVEYLGEFFYVEKFSQLQVVSQDGLTRLAHSVPFPTQQLLAIAESLQLSNTL